MMIIKRCITEGVLFQLFDVLHLFDNLHHIQWQRTILSIAIESQYLATKLYKVYETVREQFKNG